MPRVVRADEHEQVARLWELVFGYPEPRNEPRALLAEKLRHDPEGVLVIADPHVVAAVMLGYDGHRGWIYRLAVHPEHRRRGHARALVAAAEAALAARGCRKVNLQVKTGNPVVGAWEALGYAVEPRVSLGKVIDGGESGVC